MFTGLVETTGQVIAVTPSSTGKSLSLQIDASGFKDFDCRQGDSIAVNGCCLTVVGFAGKDGRTVSFDVSSETIVKTNIQHLKVGAAVNLERAVKLGDRIGGHLVSGHIDVTAEMLRFTKSHDGSLLEVRVPAAFAKYCVQKGSACLDGVSLTINDVFDHVDHSVLSFTIIPETLKVTTLGRLERPWAFNLEVDLMAKFAERLLRPV